MKLAFSSLSSLLSICLLFASTTALNGQSCTAAVCTAASANENDVLSALPSSGNTNSSVVMNIPPGIGSWTTQLTYTVPATVTNLTIQGASTVNCTGSAGTSTYSCSASDSTVIQDNDTSGNFTLLQINAAGQSTHLRITGLTLQGGTGVTKGHGLLYIQGPTHNLRVDHLHFNETTYTGGPGSFAGTVSGDVAGVADHNLYDNGTGSVQTEGFVASNPFNDTIGYGDGPWSQPTQFGTANTFYIESSQFNGGMAEDCDTGGSFVLRYNSIFNSTTISAAIHSHGTYSFGGRSRGCRFYEAYHNYIVGPSPNTTALISSEGGPSLVWGNTVASGYQNFGFVGTARNTNSRAAESSTSNSWGYCGTQVDGNGIGSSWDGNQSGTTGYPCLDGLGRGQGQALNGQNFPNAFNGITGTIAWPHQLLEPIYYFNNALPAGINELTISDISTGNNRDIYIDNSSFNGSSGTGSGLLASRPASCTAGPGGTYGKSPTGSYGVAYWATDVNSGNGELYVCTAANTWTPIYQPYSYPHPLVSGNTSFQASAPPPPTGLVGVVN